MVALDWTRPNNDQDVNWSVFLPLCPFIPSKLTALAACFFTSFSPRLLQHLGNTVHHSKDASVSHSHLFVVFGCSFLTCWRFGPTCSISICVSLYVFKIVKCCKKVEFKILSFLFTDSNFFYGHVLQECWFLSFFRSKHKKSCSGLPQFIIGSLHQPFSSVKFLCSITYCYHTKIILLYYCTTSLLYIVFWLTQIFSIVINAWILSFKVYTFEWDTLCFNSSANLVINLKDGCPFWAWCIFACLFRWTTKWSIDCKHWDLKESDFI